MGARHTNCVITVSLTLMLAFGGCSQSPEAKKAKHMERGVNYFQNAKYHEAVIEFKNVVQIDPKDADGHYRLGLTYLKFGDIPHLQAALGELSKTVELDASNRDAQLKLGELYLLAREPAKARERADIILASAPQDLQGLILRGQSLIRGNEFDQGIAELKKAIKLDPQKIRTYLDLASAYMQKKDPATAEAILQQALTVDPGSTDVRVALGDLRLLTKKPEAAEVEYKRALEVDPNNEALYLKLAGFYQLTRKWTEAEGAYQKLASLKPTDEKPQILLGEFYKTSGQREKALASFLRAVEINSTSILARDKLIDHYLDIGKLDEAEQRVNPILEKNNKDLAGRFFDARLRLARGKPDEAIERLQDVIKDAPQSAPMHQFLGLAFAQKNDIGQARRELSEAVKLAPNLAEARTALAAIHQAAGSPNLAIEEAQAALRLNGRDVKAASIMGDAYLRKGDLPKAKQAFQAISKALPNEPFSLYRLGLIARAEKKDAEALAYFEQALASNPSVIEPLTQIAAIHLAKGKPVQAMERVARQLEAQPQNPLIHNLMGHLWLQAKDVERAEAAFKKSIELNQALPLSYMNLAALYLMTGKVDQAAQEYEAVLVKNPKLVPALVLLGTIYEQRKEYEKARARYEEALKIDPKFAPAANNLAVILSEQGGNIDVALNYAQVAREQRPEDPNIADTLGWIYYKKNAYLLAADLLKEAAEKLPDNPLVQYHYGLAQQKNGDVAGAKKSLKASLKLRQDFPGADEARKVLKEL
jgi:tetratricopeptide (TPR) repeat protein